MTDLFDKWRGGLKEAIAPMQNITLKTRLQARDSRGNAVAVAQSMIEEILTEFIAEFSEKTITPIFSRTFGPAVRNPSHYMPKIDLVVLEDGSVREINKKSNLTQTLYDKWSAGFNSLYRKLTKPHITYDGNKATAGLGLMSDIMDMKLSSYSVLSGASSPTAYNSFFMAAEFGTGVYASQKRTDPRTKEPDGSWWVSSPANAVGAHFVGQRGLHFLFDDTGKKANPIYRSTIESEIIPALDRFLETKFPQGNIRRGE